MKDQLLANLGTGAPQGFVDNINHAFELSELVRSHAADVKANRNLTPIGRVEEMKRFLTSGDFRARYNKIQRSISTASDYAQSQLASLRPKDVDRTDAFAESQRKETREYLMTLQSHVREHMARMDDAAREAILQAPALVKSAIVPGHVLKEIEELEIERLHGPKLAENKKLRDQIGVVRSALDIVKVDMANASELPPHEFAAAIAA